MDLFTRMQKAFQCSGSFTIVISVYLLNHINPVEFTMPCTLTVMSVAVQTLLGTRLESMETISVDVSVTLGINDPCMTASMEDIGVVSTVYTLRQLVLPADETCIQELGQTNHTHWQIVKGIIVSQTYLRKTERYNWVFLGLKENITSDITSIDTFRLCECNPK